jgi:pimeloyl-ACP methyl ester carboxylesterase
METAMAPRETFETIDGCKIRIVRAGTGAPLLYLHGAASPTMWAPHMEQLAQHFDVIAPDHPGYGASDMPDWLDNVGDLAYFYLDALEALKLDHVHIVGASLGGWIAAEMAVRNCARIKAMTLVAPAGLKVKGAPNGDIFLWTPEQLVRNLFHDQALAERALAVPLSDEQLNIAARNRLTTARLAWQPRLHNPDLPKWLHRINVPVQIIWGDHDKVTPAAHGPVYAKLIPGPRLEIMAGCGHVAQMEKPAEFVAKVVAFAGENKR